MESNDFPEITPIKRPAFSPGDVVVLKSGSDKMTVEKVEKNSTVHVVMFAVTGQFELRNGTDVPVYYEEGPMRYSFAAEALTKVE